MAIAKRARVGTDPTVAQRGPTHAVARRGAAAMADGTGLAKVHGTAHGMAPVTLGAATRLAWATPLFVRSVMPWKTRNMP